VRHALNERAVFGKQNQKMCSIILRTKKATEEKKRIEKYINNVKTVRDSYLREMKMLTMDKEIFNKEIV